MKKIHNYTELLQIKTLIHLELVEYLNEEFYGMYEYLSNDEKLDEFQLDTHQAIIILENKDEVNQLLNNAVEFNEDIQLKTIMVQRVGVYSSDDVQVYFFVKDYNGKYLLKD